MHCAGLQSFGNVFSSASWRHYNSYCKGGVTKCLRDTNKLEQERKRAKYLSAVKRNVSCVRAQRSRVWWQPSCSSISCVAPVPPTRLVLPQLTLCYTQHTILWTLASLIFFHVRYSNPNLKHRRCRENNKHPMINTLGEQGYTSQGTGTTWQVVSSLTCLLFETMKQILASNAMYSLHDKVIGLL